MQLWSPEHIKTLIPAVFCMLALGAVLRFTLGDKDIKVRMIPFRIVACMLFALEVGKQALSLYRGYSLYHLPFHFCSMFIFVPLIMAFYNGKHKDAVRAFTTAICGALFLLMLIYPDLIYSGGSVREFFTDYMSFHTVAFHNLAMLEFVLIIALRLHTPGAGDTRAVLAGITVFCAVSAVMAQLLKTNFANFYKCNIPVFEELRQSLQGTLGYVGTQALYIAVLVALNVLFVLLSYGLYRGLLRLTEGREPVTRKAVVM